MTSSSEIFASLNYVSPLLKPIFDPQIFTHISNVVQLKKRTLLYSAGDAGKYVYVIISGLVEHFIISENGAKKTMGISGAGCLVGELPMFNNMLHFCYAQVNEDSLLHKIPCQSFLDFVENDPVLLKQLLFSMGQKIHILQTQIELLEFCDAVSRIARTLLYLCNDHGVSVQNEILIGLKFTHCDMAFMTGLSRVTVSNTFGQLTREGVIRKKSGRYFIINQAKLEALC